MNEDLAIKCISYYHKAALSLLEDITAFDIADSSNDEELRRQTWNRLSRSVKDLNVCLEPLLSVLARTHGSTPVMDLGQSSFCWGSWLVEEATPRLFHRQAEQLGVPPVSWNSPDKKLMKTRLAMECNAAFSLLESKLKEESVLETANLVMSPAISLAVERKAPKESETDNAQELEGIGPTVQGCFLWNGKRYSGFQPIPWLLLKFVWHSPSRTAPYSERMAEEVWGDRNYEYSDSPVKNAAKKIRDFFKENGIPLTCSDSRKWRTVSISPRNPD